MADYTWCFENSEEAADLINKLEKENAELEANLSRLNEALRPLYNAFCEEVKPDSQEIDYAIKVYEETPAQSLAEIESAAVEKFKIDRNVAYFRYSNGEIIEIIEDQLKDFAFEIRNQAKESKDD